ncbi:nucleotide-diphospho-sugar transferase [Mucilaginibacter sp.]|uniref:nucleotide-diphospho-sugar transferase n=1 Tax=Mucilaginibacter sp. TaxID=1882438 RepID=UPI0026073AFD|nr:nucleotide-diphospho-sugar transferase [Mucilaginibacter sp.]MDB4926962.1 hypothetical protein [Mucilaginibacter sp.]
MPVNTPVLFLVFNRPQLTASVFEAIKKARPTQLFIAADGPRKDKNEDNLCTQVRLIATQVDWPCEVHTLFREENLGCGKAVSEAITWFFDHVEQGIILEDDCLPNESFFDFCEVMLKRYQNDTHIMMISGTSYQPTPLNSNSYYISKYVHVWGWATWRRAWKLYSFELKGFNKNACTKMLKRTFPIERERVLWLSNFSHILNGFDTWDYQWMYCIWNNSGVCVIPWRNMISNIGFGPDATHTLSENSTHAKMKQFDLLNVIHPQNTLPDNGADRFMRYNVIIDSPFKHFKQKLRTLLKKILIRYNK